MIKNSTEKVKKNLQDTFKKYINNINFWKGAAISLFAIALMTQLFEISVTPKVTFLKNLLNKNTAISQKTEKQSSVVTPNTVDSSAIAEKVLPNEGVELPIAWGDLGKKMIKDGVIDEQKFRALFETGLDTTEEQWLTGDSSQPVILNQQNSRYLLDLLWAFGLANKNDILDNGEMTNPSYGGAGNFASTGGWSLSKGEAMDHYSKYTYVTLTNEQQALVDKVSRNIYRPCCGNSTHFPDCNHGMAMLGLLELMAKNGVNEQEMYDIALKVNSFWFPQTYIDLATYFQEQGKDWDQVDPKTALGKDYSSSQGYQNTRQQIQSLPKPQQGSGGCGA